VASRGAPEDSPLTVRIAIHHVDDVGLRAGRILLGERRLDALGVVGRRPNRSTDSRLELAGDLAGYDVLVSDDVHDPWEQAGRALEAGVNCVLWYDGDDDTAALGPAFAERGRTLLTGANLANGIAPCLAFHETARSKEILDVSCAWTEPGRPLRRGEALPFPDPIGARWGRPREGTAGVRRFVAPIDGEWAGAMARVTEGSPEGVVVRVVGVADLAAHLEALALAAGALAVSEYGYGLVAATDRPEDYLAASLDAGLDVAAYSMAA
jgi:hypothetical protein